MDLNRIAVFCASSDRVDAAYVEAARHVGRVLAKKELPLVYGGSQVGLMGAVADACLDAGGQAYGVIPQRLVTLERAHKGLSELFVVDSMHARKMVMASLSSAFVALPGGFGTLDETFEALTWNQLGYHRKPVGLLNVEGYFDPLLRFLDEATEKGFIVPSTRELLLHDDDFESLLTQFEKAELPARPRWMDAP